MIGHSETGIFNNKSARLGFEIGKDRTVQLLNNYENSFLVALREVEDVMISVTTYQNVFLLRREQLNAAREAVKLYQALGGGWISPADSISLKAGKSN